MLGGEAEFRQQFMTCFVDLLSVFSRPPLKPSSQAFVLDMFEGIILANLDHRQTPFTRLELAFRMTEAALPLFPQVEQVVTRELLIRCLRWSSFETIRLLAFNLLKKLEHPVDALVPNAIRDLKRLRACHNEGAAMLIELAFLQGSVRLNTLIDELAASVEQNDNPNGLLIAIRRLYILEPVTVGRHEDSLMTTKLVHAVISLLESAESSTTHPTPEGLQLWHDDGGGLLEDAPRFNNQLVPLSWRTIREGSRLLAVVARHTSDRSLFDHLVSLMLRLRHPGAFSSLVEPLSMLASCFEVDVVVDLVEKQLKVFGEVSTSRRSAGLPLCLQALLVGQTSSLPHSLDTQGLKQKKRQTNLKHRFDHPQCHRTVDALLAILSQKDARDEGEEASGSSNSSNTIKVHALNCLRAITREARLVSFVTPFLPALLTACIACMQQPTPPSQASDTKTTTTTLCGSNWGIRNSASMLFAVLTVRLFGSEHNRACIDERELERRCPGTVDCILSLLSSPNNDLPDDEDGHAKRTDSNDGGGGGDVTKASFPMLSIIRRIKPATLRCRQAFAAYARRVLGSDEIRVRRQAAIILAHTNDEPLLHTDGHEEEVTWNELHGRMLLKPIRLSSPLKSLPPPTIFASYDLSLLTVDDLHLYFEQMKEHPLVSIARQAAVAQAPSLLFSRDNNTDADADGVVQTIQKLLSVKDLFADPQLLASIIDSGLFLKTNRTKKAVISSIAQKAIDLCFYSLDAIRHYSLALSLLRAFTSVAKEEGGGGGGLRVGTDGA